METIQSIKEEDELEIIDNIEIIREDELFDESFETTKSATELCNLDDLDDIEGYIIDDQAYYWNIDGQDNIFKEIESTYKESLSCKLCQQDFSNNSNLYRHLKCKKHKAIETALYVETFKIGVPVTDELQIIQDKTFEIDNDQYKIIIETIKSKDLDSAAKEIYEIRAEPQRVQNKQFNFKCTFCMKSFSNSSNLRRHTNLHLPDDIYKCAFCPRKFKQREYWKKHLEVCRNKLAKAMTDWSLFETTYNQLLLN